MTTYTSTDSYINNLLSQKIDISRTQREQGSTSHNNARAILHSRKDSDSAFPWLMETDFLSGSFARKTKLKPLDDIDVMMVIDGGDFTAFDARGVYGKIEGTTQSGNPLSVHNDFRGHVKSSSIVDAFARALNDAYPSVTAVRKDNQAVNVYFSSYGLGLDIVPCFKVLPYDQNEQEHYFIPAGNAGDHWIKTNPKLDDNLVSVVQKQHDGMFKSLVKIIKYWNIEMNDARLNSYHVELMASVALHNQTSINTRGYIPSLLLAFQTMSSLLENPFEDLWKLGEPIDRSLSAEDRNASRQAVAQAVRYLQSANEMNNLGRVGDAITYLDLLFVE